MNVIQLGTNDGKDYVLDFCRKHRGEIDKILLVDANSACTDKVKLTYADFPQATVETLAIVTELLPEGRVKFYTPERDDASQYASLLASHVNFHEGRDNKGLREHEVAAISINELFERHGFKTIDWLYVDLEGLDVPVISTINFAQFDVRNIVFEKTHSDGPFNCGTNYQQLVKHLVAFGFAIELNKYPDPNNVLAKK